MDQPKTLAEAFHMLKTGGIFGAVVWKWIELQPFSGALMAFVTGEAPVLLATDAPPLPLLAWKDVEVVNKLLIDVGFNRSRQMPRTRSSLLSDLDVIAMMYIVLPVLDVLTKMETDSVIPDAWKKLEEAWPVIAKEKGRT